MHTHASPRVRATCWRVVDCGVQTWWWHGQPRRVRELHIGFELLDERTRAGDRVALDARYNFTLAARSTLRRDLQAWLSRSLTRAEIAGRLDFAALLSRSCTLSLTERETPVGRYRRIEAVGPAFGPDYPANRPPFFFSLAPDGFEVDAFPARDSAGADWPAEHVRPATLAEKLGDEIPW